MMSNAFTLLIIVLGLNISAHAQMLSDVAPGEQNMTGKVLAIDSAMISTDNAGSVRSVQLPTNVYFELNGNSLRIRQAPGYGPSPVDVGGYLQRPLNLTVMSQRLRTNLTLPAHRTRVSREADGWRIYVSEDKEGNAIDYSWDPRHGIAIDPDGKEVARAALWQAHREQKLKLNRLIDQFEKYASEKDYVSARTAYAKLVDNELYADDLVRTAAIFQMIPETERPLNSFASEFRELRRKLKLTFPGRDFDQLTLTQFLEFADAWASKDPAIEIAPNSEFSDTNVVLDIVEQLGINTETHMRILNQTVNARIEAMAERVREGDSNVMAMVSEDDFAVEKAIRTLKTDFDQAGQDAINKFRERIQTEDEPVQQYLKQRWFYFVLSN